MYGIKERFDKMLKKTIIFLLINSLLFVQVSDVFAKYNPNPLNMSEEDYNSVVTGYVNASVKNLEKLGIIKTPFDKWDSDDYISRKNSMEMVYLIHKLSYREIWEYDEYIEFVKEKGILFPDVMETDNEYDIKLVLSLNREGLILGKKQDGKYIADIYSNLTYYEAFTLLYRLILNYHKYSDNVSNLVDSWEEEYPYFRFMEEFGLINNNTIVNYSTLTIDESMMDKYITAYEFMHMLNSVMYMQHLRMTGDYGWNISGDHLIDDYKTYHESYGEPSGINMYIP